MSKEELLGMSLPEMEQFLTGLGEERFRARQIYRWIYRRDSGSFFDMSDLPRDLREKMDENARITIPRAVKARVSRDGTRKFLLELGDKKRIETVAIPQAWKQGKQYTLCLSSQVGCPLGCLFCATGQGGFERNLTAGEMAGQVLTAEKEIRRRDKIPMEERVISNLVFMGMGEPLLNLDSLLEAVRLINDERGINIGQRHITISTAGVVPGIRRLAEENLQVTLAVSLHATTDETRDLIIPLNRRYPIAEVLAAADDYTRETGRRATFEYLLLDGVNSSSADAHRLARMVGPLLANVNLIPFNPVEGADFKSPHPYVVQQFTSLLEKEGINVTLREEMGTDIEAACGQLRNRRLRQERGL